MMFHNPPGLVDLIAGVTPTFVDWTEDPTDAANITDNDITTFCTTGSKTMASPYQYAYIEWDLGAFHNVLCTGVGRSLADAGVGKLYTRHYDGSAWLHMADVLSDSSAVVAFSTFGFSCSRVRLGFTSNSACSLSPYVREFHVWRL